MRAKQQDIVTLKKIQDMTAMRCDKARTLKEMPERAALSAILVKEREITEKSAKVKAMQIDAKSRFEKLMIEDTKLHEREESVQRSIDHAAGDFRNLEVRTKELDGIARRRVLLAEMMIKVDEEQEKIANLNATLEEARNQITSKKKVLEEKIMSVKSEIDDYLAKSESELKDLFSALPDDLAEEYRRAAASVGSIVLSELEGDKCKVCRSTIEQGVLIDLRSGGEVGVCPHCGRLLIIEDVA